VTSDNAANNQATKIPNVDLDCDECGHVANDHEDRIWDGGDAPCRLCYCGDFRHEDEIGWDEVPRE
jgi:hypothetical protein